MGNYVRIVGVKVGGFMGECVDGDGKWDVCVWEGILF